MVTALARYALEFRAVSVEKVSEGDRLYFTLGMVESSSEWDNQPASVGGCNTLPCLARCYSTVVGERGEGKGGGSRPFQLSL